MALKVEGDPTKKPLKLQLPENFPPATSLNGIPLSSTARNAFEQITELMESELWQWDDFPIALPEPSIVSKRSESQIVWNKLFRNITYDELPELSGRNRGNVQSLNEKQLKQVRDTGEFDVPSNLFPGKNHRWLLSSLLQRGKQKIWNTFLKGLASTIRPLIVMMPDLLWKGSFSVRKGCKHLYYGLLYFPSLFVGFREVYEGPSNVVKLRTQFIMQELAIVKDSEGNEVLGLWRLQPKGGETVIMERIDQQVQDEVFDFRFLDDAYADKIRTELSDIQTQLNDKWKRIELQRRSEYVWKLQKEREKTVQPPPAAEGAKTLEEEAIELAYQEKKEELYQKVLESEKLEAILPGVGKRLVQFAQAVSLFVEEERKFQTETQAHQKHFREEIQSNHSVRGKVSEWVDNQVNDEMMRYNQINKYTVLNRVLEKLKSNGHTSEAYLLERYITFEKDHREKIEIEQKKQNLHPKRQFEYSSRIWFSSNWIITQANSHPISYSATKTTTHRVTSMWPFWRMGKFVYSTYSAFKNMNYHLFQIFWNGKFSVKSLFLASPFHPDIQLNSRTGKVETNTSKEVETLISNLNSLWTDIFQARRNFEAKPDTDFLGKSITRWFNMFWHYVIKGFFGTLLLLITRPLISLGTILVCLFLMIASPLLAVLWGFVSNIPGMEILKWIWTLFGKGLGQLIAALFLTLFCPFISIGVFLYTLISVGLRSLYDFLMFHLIVKRHAKIPSNDGFLTRRISGPGLRSSYYFQIPSEIALIAVQSRLDSMLLHETERYFRKKINEPVSVQRAVFKKYLAPFGCEMSSSSGHVQELNLRTQELHERVSSALSNFRQHNSGVQLIEVGYEGQYNKPKRSRKTKKGYEDLEAGGSNGSEEEINLRIDRGHVFYPTQFCFPVRQTSAELQKTIQDASYIVKRFFTERYFPLIFSLQFPEAEESKESKIVDFWYYKNLEQGDYIGLTCQLLEQIFQSSFLVGIDDEEGEKFVVEVKDSSVSEFAGQLLESTPIPDPLDSIRVQSILLTKKPNYRSLDGAIAISSTVFDERSSEALDSLRIRVPKLPFKPESLRITPVSSWDSNGIRIMLKGRKSRDFYVLGVRLLLDGTEIWSSLEELFGFAFVTLARSFYPVDLTPFISNVSTFNAPGEGVRELVIAVGGEGKILFKGSTLKKKLQQLVEHGDPKFTLRLEYGESSGYWSSHGDLVSVPLSASSFLKALENSSNLLA